MKTVFIICLFFGVVLQGRSQCNHQLSLEKIKPSSAANDGALQLNITTNQEYTVTLFELTGQEENEIQSRAGSLSDAVVFRNLKSTSYYKVRVDFSGEEKFLCKQKIFTYIRLTDDN